MSKSVPNTPTGSRPSCEVHPLQAALRFARVVRFRGHVVIVALVVSGLLAALYYATAARVYESKASLLVLQTGADRWSTTMSGEKAARDLIATYRKILGSDVVLEEAIALLQPEVRSDFGDAAPSELAAMVKSQGLRGRFGS